MNGYLVSVKMNCIANYDFMMEILLHNHNVYKPNLFPLLCFVSSVVFKFLLLCYVSSVVFSSLHCQL